MEDLADSPEFLRQVQNEFPDEVVTEELLSPVSRRNFLTLMGASISLAGLTGCFRRPEEYILPYSKAPEEVNPGIPNFYASTFVLGGYALGALVENHEGRPTKIEGNPDHPASLGATNVFMQASLLDLYDPDRLTQYRKDGQSVDRPSFVEAVKAKATELKARQGEGLRFLSDTSVSPTLQALKKRLSETYPKAVWHSYAPVSDENVYAGTALAFGTAARPVYNLEAAKVIFAVASDFMGMESDSVGLARQWAAGRKVDDLDKLSLNRLYAVEAEFTATGSLADHRVRVNAARVDSFLRTVALKLAEAGVEMPAEVKDGLGSAGSFGTHGDKVLAGLVKELLANRGAGAILVGRAQPAHVHALAHALNVALSNVGTTVRYMSPAEDLATQSAENALGALVTAMKAGLDTLVILGGNPAYDAPADLGFAEALKSVGTSIRLSLQDDETAEGSKWVAPRSHFLEAWGDARAYDGTASLIQPLIEPLYGSMSDVELVSLFLDVPSHRGYDLVRSTWQSQLAGPNFEAMWRKALHDGVVPEAAASPLSVALNGAALGGALKEKTAAAAASAQALEVLFVPCPKLYDGRYANNGWMQELPDPMTKLTWDNAAVMSHATAKALGVENHDLIKLDYKGRSVQLPAWILPGMADFSVALYLGYGRSKAGKVGTGVGVNVYPLRDSAALWMDAGATAVKAGDRYRLASTQLHGRLEWYPVNEAYAPQSKHAEAAPAEGEHGGGHSSGHGEMRPVVQQATVDEYRQNPKFATANMEHMPALKSIFTEHEYSGQQWGMAIDMNVCTGCNTCVIACQAENNIPVVGKTRVLNGREMAWMRLDRYFTGTEESESLEAVQQPMLCQHCENAPCEPVCPVAATVHAADGGTNDMVYNRCIGTRYCANNCPYKVRRFNYFNYHEDFPEVQKMVHNPEVTVRMRGVMEKCSYCTQRIHRARRDMKLSNQTMIPDGALTPACAQACPVQAITFGDIRDPESRVAQKKKLSRDYTVLAELNVKPRTSYLARIRNPNPELA